jgi:hypothetical protein
MPCATTDPLTGAACLRVWYGHRTLIEKVFYNFVKVIVASPHRLPKLPESTLRKQARPNNGSLFCSHHTCAWGAQIIAWAFLGLSQFLGKGAAPHPHPPPLSTLMHLFLPNLCCPQVIQYRPTVQYYLSLIYEQLEKIPLALLCWFILHINCKVVTKTLKDINGEKMI